VTKKFGKGTRVRWKWGKGTAEAKVVEAHTSRLVRTINGHEHVRNGSDDNPAYVLEQDDGQTVLKLHSELHGD